MWWRSCLRTRSRSWISRAARAAEPATAPSAGSAAWQAGPQGVLGRAGADPSWRGSLRRGGFRARPDSLKDLETAEVGDVRGRSLIHLQCHFGRDTLSWAARGAQVTGLDFPQPAIEAASRLATGLGIDARFLTADVYDAVSAVEGATFDIVYASFGALNWLPNISRWASVVAELLAPAGFLYLAEFHPFSFVLDDETGSTVTHDYFDEGPKASGGPGTYADGAAMTDNNATVEWRHSLSTVVPAIARAGLRIQFLHEHDHTFYLQCQSLERHDGDVYRHPEGAPRIPLTYSIRAERLDPLGPAQIGYPGHVHGRCEPPGRTGLDREIVRQAVALTWATRVAPPDVQPHFAKAAAYALLLSPPPAGRSPPPPSASPSRGFGEACPLGGDRLPGESGPAAHKPDPTELGPPPWTGPADSVQFREDMAVFPAPR
nr:class I SAM-dependent methyltransferase [Streptomyces sp. TLI_235]